MCGFDWNCYVNFFNYGFGQQFVASLFATFIGAGLGVGGALWVNHFVESKNTKEKKIKILTALRSELHSCNTTLSNYLKGDDIWAYTGVIGSDLRDDIWQAFSDGGELNHINDTRLLAELANTYHNVKSVMKLADKIYQFLPLPNEIILPVYLNRVYEDLLSSISAGNTLTKDTIDIIDEVLKDPSKPLLYRQVGLWK